MGADNMGDGSKKKSLLILEKCGFHPPSLNKSSLKSGSKRGHQVRPTARCRDSSSNPAIARVSSKHSPGGGGLPGLIRGSVSYLGGPRGHSGPGFQPALRGHFSLWTLGNMRTGS